MAKKQLIKVVGKTTDGQPVVIGVYRFCETVGVPLTDTLCALKDLGVMPSWPAFYEEALAAGMEHERILTRLDEALFDTYGREFRDVVIGRLAST